MTCLDHLIARGWGNAVSIDLCKQLFYLLNLLLLREQPIAEDQDSLISVLSCLASFFTSTGDSFSCLYRKEDEKIVPITGQVMDSVLTALSESQVTKTQIAASGAVYAMIVCIDDQQLLRNFLPGIISQYSKILQASTARRRSYRVLVACLQGTAKVLSKTVGSHEPSSNNTLSMEKRVLSSWEKASSTQLKQALSNIATLRYHERLEVTQTLFSLCITVLEDCHYVLKNCSDLMLETAIVICSQIPSLTSDISRLVSKIEIFKDHLISQVSSWLSSLPRTLESGDELLYKRHISKICTAFTILITFDEDISYIYEDLTMSLKNSAITIFRAHSQRLLAIDQTSIVDASLALTIRSSSKPKPQFKPILLGQRQDDHLLKLLEELLNILAQFSVWSILQNRFAVSLVGVPHDEVVPSYWLLSRLINRGLAHNQVKQRVADLNEEYEHDKNDVSSLAIFHASEILCHGLTRNDGDWRLEAIALEIIACEAQRQGSKFRPELVDVLFPIVERVGSKMSLLQEHAIVCLDIVSSSCGYASSGELIIQNVDYMVNAVALKFGTYEISPEASQVLVMMLELSGPSLLPYLDDLVNSIFSTLGSFHGYPRLVESLFSVLNSMVSLYRDSTSKLLDASIIQQKVRKNPVQVTDVIHVIKSTKPFDDVQETKFEDHPDELMNHNGSSNVLITDQSSRTVQLWNDGTPLSARDEKSYTIVLSIARLSQHYLTQGSPYLRQQLLQLISISCDSLRKNEDEFLPLINDIWPVVIKRLYDEKAIVSLAASETMISIFQSAGDFVATRIEDDWHDLVCLCRRIHSQMKLDEEGKATRGKFSSAYRLWEGIVKLLLNLITFVRINPEMEDDVFDMLGPLIVGRTDVRNALEYINPDGVWLLEQAGQHWYPGFEVDEFKFDTIVP